jgi:hypothetical protein
VDSVLWDEFVDWVEERHGSVRGVLGEELEIAIRQRMDTDDREVEAADIHRIDARLERIEQAVDVAQSDGGVDSRSADTHTHTESVDPGDKPHSKAAKERKIRWIGAKFTEKYGSSDGQAPVTVPKAKITDFVVEAYAFDGDLCEDYVDRVIDHLGYMSHPDADDVLVTPDQHEKLTGGDES